MGGGDDFSHAYITVHQLQLTSKKQKLKKKLIWKIKHVFLHDYFMHFWPTLWAINSKPNEYK